MNKPKILMNNMQKMVFNALCQEQKKGGKLRPHITGARKKCWRLLDAQLNPIMNIRDEEFTFLVSSGYLERGDEFSYIVHQ